MRSSRMMEVRPHLAHRELGTYDEPPGQASTLAGPVQRGEPGPEEPCGAQETGSPVPPLAGGAWPLGGLVSSSGWTARARGRRPGLEHGGAAVVGGAAAAAPPGLRDGVAEPLRYQRAVADSENIRRRTQRCVEDAKIFGIQSFCKDLVEVADILEKTAECFSEGAKPEDHKLTLEKVFQGLSLLEAKLKSVFAKHGLEKMTPIGDKYDPHEHELICHMPAGVGVQPGTVALVRQDGYKLHGRTIRLAQVEVAVESQRRL
ncbi:grpE protein homolog 2, mitochondrial isoform X1 [Peromyscus maniculatus bairdii]|uniref:grpE protein homolog 2, mitochondrial isoform X1 n=1 Tax=Peromyscus maniculatus bairdii TaxID=230844 RepID=UPI001C2E1C00|nr:grpE protein homolog 2, mitochondrial isoform X1 [Peromyscus maniculatus bairdii]